MIGRKQIHAYCLSNLIFLPLISHNFYENIHAFHSPFFTRDSIIYAIARICYANSVCLSVTRVICVKTAERIIEFFLPSDSPIIQVFRHQGSLRKSGGFTPNGGANTRGVAIFDQYAAISRKR